MILPSEELVPRSAKTAADVAYQPATLPSLLDFANAIAKSSIAPPDARGDVAAVAAMLAFGASRGMMWAQSLNEISVIKGKISASAALLHTWVQQSPDCETFDVIESTAERAVIRVKRKDWTDYRTYSYSIEDAKRAGIMRQGGAWFTNPRAMLVARARSGAARLWFPGVVTGVYASEELRDGDSPATVEATGVAVVVPEAPADAQDPKPSTPLGKLRAAAKRVIATAPPPEPTLEAEIVPEPVTDERGEG